uniref:hypothetical protein n=1 Tax=Flavobacterium sp. WG21 TaxID=1229487 RepID=UPI00055495B3
MIFSAINQKLYLLALTLLSAQFFNITWVYQGLEKFGIINRLIFFSKAIYVLLVYILIREKEDYYFVLFLLGAANTFIYLFYFIKIWKSYKLSLLDVKGDLIKKQFKNEYAILV